MSELSWQPSDMDGLGDKGIVAVADDYEFHITGPLSGHSSGMQWMAVTNRLSDPCDCVGLPNGMFSDRLSAQRAAARWAEQLVLYGELRVPYHADRHYQGQGLHTSSHATNTRRVRK